LQNQEMDETKIRVNEESPFLTCQGEGVYAGVPSVFVRFQGCNLFPSSCCGFCDTKYAQDLSGGKDMTVLEIAREVNELLPYYQSWVCITGGEPLHQEDGLHQLIKKLRALGYRTEIETNGTIKKPDWWTIVNSWVADIKCPSSGVVSLVDEWFNTRECDQVKFVVGNKEDLDYARKTVMRNAARSPVRLVSPVILSTGGEVVLASLDRKLLQEVWKFCIETRARFSLQTHKIVFGNRRGV
jgi:7-carboxy-7-deazaguanine synthase